MERQKNYLQLAGSDKTLLPIERELLSSVLKKIEFNTGLRVTDYQKYYSHALYDCFLIICGEKENKTPYFLKVNLSPDLPNSWAELAAGNFTFHPKIICSSSNEDEFKFICFQVPKGIFLSHISKYPLNPKLNIQRAFISTLNEMHKIKISNEDKTIDIFNSMLPRESMMIFKTYPIVDLFASLKIIFKQNYKSDITACGLCHFDLSPENIIYNGEEIKFINFEYSGNANIYLDTWLAKQTLNCSEDVFDKILESLPKDEAQKVYAYQELSYLFNFAYFNSKIVSEYITFGVSNSYKFKYWINQSEACYNKIFNKLFVEKKIDKLIRDFYYLWK